MQTSSNRGYLDGAFEHFIEGELDLRPLNSAWNTQEMQRIIQDYNIVREVPPELLVADLNHPDLYLIGELNKIHDAHLRLLVCISVLKLFFGYGKEDGVT